MRVAIKRIDQEMIIVPYANGIRLERPEAVLRENTHTAHTSIAALLQLPFSFYLLNTDSATQLINDEGAAICGFDSIRDSYGKTLHAVSEQTSATMLINNCQQVMQTESRQLFEETNARKDGEQLQFLSLKMPWFNDNKIIGVMGCSIALGKHALAGALQQLTALGLLEKQKIASPVMPSLPVNNIHLTQREMQCLQLTIQGLTAKKIAQKLSISHRTVEEYLTNIREKAGVNSKSQLIEMTIDSFYEARA